MKSFSLLIVILLISWRAEAELQTPALGTTYTQVDWGPLNPDGNSLSTALGVIDTGGAGGSVFVASEATLSGQNAVFGIDSLDLTFLFGFKQILFNITYGSNVPSEMVIYGGASLGNSYETKMATVSLPGSGQTYIDLIALSPIVAIQFTPSPPNIEQIGNHFNVGTMYFSNSSEPMAGNVQYVPEPSSLALLIIGLTFMFFYSRSQIQPK
ncbi:MAG: PEP-CTERM sorting domain-containing protein [Acetobacteraceae bacterium]|nr:PEP-CTERM sorting domain-containing protein [Acetobacteraceae bacterium]